ncbi:hypothetical protein PBY51_005555 [Eleginops maclovinus]|uniref:Uncharacterized protein n=1 Tax=Eleginops maclovinus TaxID=56733 RepID=A0AAN7X8K9_ELEMC|nr:hypothetical protein PBY51_005555 [Eleginops maclovinus]
MAQRESITAITLVICQSCWALEERGSHSHAASLLPSSSSSSSLSSHQPMAVRGRRHVILLPVIGPLWSTAGRWHPFPTLPRSHSRTPSSEEDEDTLRPADTL